MTKAFAVIILTSCEILTEEFRVEIGVGGATDGEEFAAAESGRRRNVDASGGET